MTGPDDTGKRPALRGPGVVRAVPDRGEALQEEAREALDLLAGDVRGLALLAGTVTRTLDGLAGYLTPALRAELAEGLAGVRMHLAALASKVQRARDAADPWEGP